MLDNIKQTAKHTLIYSIGNLSTKLIGLILLPIYTSKLTTGDYGILAYLETTSLFIITILSFGLPTGILRFCTSDNKEKDKEIIFTVFTFALAISLLVLVPLFIFRLQLSHILLEGPKDLALINLLLVIIPLEVINSLTLSVIRLREKSKFYVFLVVSKFTLALLFNIYFIVEKGMKVEGIMLSQLISSATVILLSLWFLSRNMVLRFHPKLLKEMIAYSFPLIFSMISSMALAMSDRYIIEYFIDFSELGVYSLGVKFAGLINVFIIQSFQLGYLPIAFKIYNQPDAKKFFTKIMTYLTLVLIVTSLAVSLFSKEAIILIARKNPDFWRAFLLIPVLCLGHVFKGIQYLLSLSMHYVKKTKINAFVVVFCAALNIGINLVIVKPLGIFGAALSTFFCYFVMAVIYYFYSQKYYRMNYEWSRIILLFLTGILLFLFSHYVLEEVNMLNLLLKLVLMIAYPGILYVLGFYHKVELERIGQFWKKWKKISNLRENILSLQQSEDTLLKDYD